MGFILFGCWDLNYNPKFPSVVHIKTDAQEVLLQLYKVEPNSIIKYKML